MVQLIALRSGMLEIHALPKSCTIKESSLCHNKPELPDVANVVEWVRVEDDKVVPCSLKNVW